MKEGKKIHKRFLVVSQSRVLQNMLSFRVTGCDFFFLLAPAEKTENRSEKEELNFFKFS